MTVSCIGLGHCKAPHLTKTRTRLAAVKLATATPLKEMGVAGTMEVVTVAEACKVLWLECPR